MISWDHAEVFTFVNSSDSEESASLIDPSSSSELDSLRSKQRNIFCLPLYSASRPNIGSRFRLIGPTILKDTPVLLTFVFDACCFCCPFRLHCSSWVLHASLEAKGFFFEFVCVKQYLHRKTNGPEPVFLCIGCRKRPSVNKLTPVDKELAINA